MTVDLYDASTSERLIGDQDARRFEGFQLRYDRERFLAVLGEAMAKVVNQGNVDKAARAYVSKKPSA